MKKLYRLPEGFKFGSSASAWQTEGWTGKKEHQRNFVDMMYLAEPERWFNGVGTIKSTDFYNRYEEDIKLMKELGIQVYRTSIDWSRFITDYETNEVDQDALRFYEKVIDCLIENGIEPMLCLEHWEIPEYVINKYGTWDNRKVMELFVGYSKKVMAAFHDKIKYWWTINEPAVVPNEAYLFGNIWPYEENTKKSVQMNYHRVLATSLLVEHHAKMGYQGKVGIILNPSPSYPKSMNNPKDIEAAKICDMFNYKQYTDPLINGKFDEAYFELLKKHECMFEYVKGDFEKIDDNKIEVVGINYYQSLRVRQRETAWNPDKPFIPTAYYETYSPRGIKMNFSRGWEIYPKGIYDMLKIIQNDYRNIECWITENGMGVMDEDKFKDASGQIQDSYRIEFLSDHMAWMLKAIDEGCDCRGFLNWTFTDNLSPVNAFRNRYGFVEIDMENNRNRRIKKSGDWVKELMRTRCFEAEDTEPEYK